MKQICSELFDILARFDTVPTIKQLVDIKKYLCRQHLIRNFSEFAFNEDDDYDNNYLDLVSFIHKYREKIDPHGDLSIYEYSSSIGNDRQEIYSFVNQLTMVRIWREKQSQDEHFNQREIVLAKNQISAMEKALQYKYPGINVNNRIPQIMKKAKSRVAKETRTIIQ